MKKEKKFNIGDKLITIYHIELWAGGHDNIPRLNTLEVTHIIESKDHFSYKLDRQQGYCEEERLVREDGIKEVVLKFIAAKIKEIEDHFTDCDIEDEIKGLALKFLITRRKELESHKWY